MIKYNYPLAHVWGTDGSEKAIAHGVKDIPLLLLDARSDKLPFPHKYFDYIIIKVFNDDSNMLTATEAQKLFSSYIKSDRKAFYLPVK